MAQKKNVGLRFGDAQQTPIFPIRKPQIEKKTLAGRGTKSSQERDYVRKNRMKNARLPAFCFRTTMSPHESDRKPERRGDAESALESAARQLGRIAAANGGTPASQRRILQGRQERDLEIWAKENGCWLNFDESLQGFIKGGEEHRVRPGDDTFLKATHVGHYGFTVIADGNEPILTRALPGEYLHRLLLSNRIFLDCIELLGVTREPSGLVIITSQPTVVGAAATGEEMIAWFETRHFALLPNLSLGYSGGLSFYRDLDQLAAFDLHPANVLRDRNGVIFPIDVVMVEADDELAALLSDHL